MMNETSDSIEAKSPTVFLFRLYDRRCRQVVNDGQAVNDISCLEV